MKAIDRVELLTEQTFFPSDFCGLAWPPRSPIDMCITITSISLHLEFWMFLTQTHSL